MTITSEGLFLFDVIVVVRRPSYTLYHGRHTRYTTTAIHIVRRPPHNNQKPQKKGSVSPNAFTLMLQKVIQQAIKIFLLPSHFELLEAIYKYYYTKIPLPKYSEEGFIIL